MTRSLKLTIAVAAGGLAGAIAVIALISARGPVHRGKTWSQWLEEADYGKPEPMRTEAATAIREIGTNMLPRLLGDLRPGDSRLKWQVIRLLQRQSVVKLKFTTPDDRCRRAYWAIHALGPAAKPIAPELIRLFDTNPGYTLAAYASIGAESLPVLTQALTNTNPWVRWNAATALLDFTPADTRDVVPLLAAGLADTNANVRARMAEVLRQLHPDEYERAAQPGNQ